MSTKKQSTVVVEEKQGSVYRSHPSFGSVVLHRVSSSGSYLAGSAVKHRGFVCLSVSEAQFVEHGYGHESVYSKKQIIQVAMTEAQFAELISRWNVGDGTPCTIMRRPDPSAPMVGVEEPPRDQTARERFDGVIADAVSGVSTLIGDTVKEIEAIVGDRLPKKQKEKLDMALRVLRENAPADLKYVTTGLNEVAEKITARAKTEMEAAGRALVEKLGLGAVADQALKLLPAPPLDAPEDDA